jgi:hypothetical protein
VISGRTAIQCTLLCGLVVAAGGGQLRAAESVNAEIEMLLQRLAASGCSFQRNGTWHTAGDATRHLRRKLAHTKLHAPLASAEMFVQLAATRSSESGVPYIVRCPGAAPETAGDWLLRQLAAVRAARP